MSLERYRKKRKFTSTPEPKGGKKETGGPLRFVIQKHRASHLHYDFRLEMDGVLKSWAVPKGPSLNPDDKRLAMMVEDHPLEYANFEGIIPKGNYGAGAVMVWDTGVYRGYEDNLLAQLKKGHITIVLLGEKLKGEFALVRSPKMSENAWLLLKAGDEYVSTKDILKKDRSVITGRSMDEIASEAVKKKEIWHSRPKNLDLGDAKKAPMPKEVRPMLAKTVDTPFDRANWIYEIKWDGYRAIAQINSEKVNLYSRNGISYNEKFESIAKSLTKFSGNAVLDGEIVMLDSTGRPDFQLLQDYPSTKSKGELVFYVFDILHFDGRDLTDLPLVKRKEILRSVIPPLDGIRYSDYVEESGRAFFSVAQKLNLEGIMAKDAESRYLIGQRSDSWLKIKTGKTQIATIAGFTSPKGNRSHIGALILGIRKQGKLIYIGHTGGGFNDENLKTTLEKLTPLITDECPFDEVPKTNAPATWVRPVIKCEVTFKEWTKDNKMRHPIFSRFLEEQSNNSKKSEFTHLTKTFWPKEKYTKEDLINYYSEIASVILPYLKDRPQSLLRFPDGIKGKSFYQKESSTLGGDWIKRVAIHSESGDKKINFMLCQDKESLLYMVNLGCIDFNPWSSKIDNLDNPDYLILDLDPEKASFQKVIEVANVVREVLEKLNIKSFPKTSGKRGMHIYIPVEAKYSYEQVRQFAQILALQVQAKLPKLVSLKHSPKERVGKIYIDYLRNARGATAASVYSARAYPNATVSTPLYWNEVTKKLDPSKFNIKTIMKRLDKHGDLFKPVLGAGIDIEKILQLLH